MGLMRLFRSFQSFLCEQLDGKKQRDAILIITLCFLRKVSTWFVMATLYVQ